jgi:hypothetical protein
MLDLTWATNAQAKTFFGIFEKKITTLRSNTNIELPLKALMVMAHVLQCLTAERAPEVN